MQRVDRPRWLAPAFLVGAAAAILTVGGGGLTSPAVGSSTPPTDLAAPIRVSGLEALIADPDGSLRFTNSGGEGWPGGASTVSTISALNVVSAPSVLAGGTWGGKPAFTALTPDAATAIVDPTKHVRFESKPKPTRFVARTRSLQGVVHEQRLGAPGQVYDVHVVESGQGSIAIQGIRQVGAGRYRPLLMYRAAGSSEFSAPVSLGRGDTMTTYAFAFAADGTAVAITEPGGTTGNTFRRIARDGTLGPTIRFGSSPRESYQVAAGFTPAGDLIVAQLQPPTPDSEQLGLYVATLPAGASTFTEPQRVDLLTGFAPYEQVALAATADGHVTVMASSDRQVRFYAVTPAGLAPTMPLDTPAPDYLQLVNTADGGVAAIWTAQQAAGSRTRVLWVAQRGPVGSWSPAIRIAAGKGSRDPDGSPGIYTLAAAPLPDRGVAVAYRVEGRRQSQSYVQRVLP